MNNEPVILVGMARIVAAALVAFAAKRGLTLNVTEIVAGVLAAETAVSLWVRSRVSPVK